MPPESRWEQEIELCANLHNVSLSRNRRVGDVQKYTTNVSLDELHLNGKLNTHGRGGKISLNVLIE